MKKNRNFYPENMPQHDFKRNLLYFKKPRHYDSVGKKKFCKGIICQVIVVKEGISLITTLLSITITINKFYWV